MIKDSGKQAWEQTRVQTTEVAASSPLPGVSGGKLHGNWHLRRTSMINRDGELGRAAHTTPNTNNPGRRLGLLSPTHRAAASSLSFSQC